MNSSAILSTVRSAVGDFMDFIAFAFGLIVLICCIVLAYKLYVFSVDYYRIANGIPHLSVNTILDVGHYRELAMQILYLAAAFVSAVFSVAFTLISALGARSSYWRLRTWLR